MKIFVSIVSYRDPLLSLTMHSLLDNASANHDIIIGIFEQTIHEDSLLIKDPELLKNKNIRYKRINPEYSDGPSWARYINCLQIVDEDFFYQVDSHMLFEKDWDCYLIADYNVGKEKHNTDKIIITANCKIFDLDETGLPVLYGNDDKLTCKVKYFVYQAYDLPGAHGELFPATDYIEPAIHICAGNFFTHISWLKNVGIDPKLYFEPEEFKMVLGSFTAGYHLYHPRSIHCYHYINTAKYFTKQWFKPVITKEQYGLLVWNSLMHWQEYLNNLDRSILEAYYDYSGLDYINKTIDERALTRSIQVAPATDDIKPAEDPWKS